MSKAELALQAVKAITALMPETSSSYKKQRVVENAYSLINPPDSRCKVRDVKVVPTDDTSRNIPVRIFIPQDADSTDSSLDEGLKARNLRGTVLFFHGGGWANGSIDFYAAACSKMAIELQRTVVVVGYRLAPENRFPAAVEDCYEVAKQLFEGKVLPDINPDEIVLVGDSAGGNLAAVVVQLARDRGEFVPRNQVLIYPLVYNDHSETSIFDSVRENGEGYLLERQDVVEYTDLYLSKPEDIYDPLFSPMLNPDLGNLARTLIITAEFCPLRDEGEVYAELLKDAGNQVACFRILNGVHGYFLFPSVFNLLHDTYSIIRWFLDGETLDSEDERRWIKITDTSSTT